MCSMKFNAKFKSKILFEVQFLIEDNALWIEKWGNIPSLFFENTTFADKLSGVLLYVTFLELMVRSVRNIYAYSRVPL